MDVLNTRLIFKILTGITLISLFAHTQVFAIGTESGTSVSNQATVTYTVGGVNQSIASDGDAGTAGNQTTDFIVDTKIDHDLTLVSAADLGVDAGQDVSTPTSPSPGTPIVHEFTLTNLGNADTFYELDVANPGSGDFSVDDYVIYIDDDGTAGFNPATDTNSGVDTSLVIPSALVHDSGSNTLTVYVATTVGSLQAPGATSQLALLATAVADGAGTPLVEDSDGNDIGGAAEIVFADGNGAPANATDVDFDAIYALDFSVTVNASLLTVTKDVLVLNDGLGSEDATDDTVDPDALMIPGATIRYRFTITNTSASSAATAVTVTDNLPPQVAFENAGTDSFDIPAACENDGPGTSNFNFNAPAEVELEDISIAASGVCVVTVDAIIL